MWRRRPRPPARVPVGGSRIGLRGIQSGPLPTPGIPGGGRAPIEEASAQLWSVFSPPEGALARPAPRSSANPRSAPRLGTARAGRDSAARDTDPPTLLGTARPREVHARTRFRADRQPPARTPSARTTRPVSGPRATSFLRRTRAPCARASQRRADALSPARGRAARVAARRPRGAPRGAACSKGRCGLARAAPCLARPPPAGLAATDARLACQSGRLPVRGDRLRACSKSYDEGNPHAAVAPGGGASRWLRTPPVLRISKRTGRRWHGMCLRRTTWNRSAKGRPGWAAAQLALHLRTPAAPRRPAPPPASGAALHAGQPRAPQGRSLDATDRCHQTRGLSCTLGLSVMSTTAAVMAPSATTALGASFSCANTTPSTTATPGFTYP